MNDVVDSAEPVSGQQCGMEQARIDSVLMQQRRYVSSLLADEVVFETSNGGCERHLEKQQQGRYGVVDFGRARDTRTLVGSVGFERPRPRARFEFPNPLPPLSQR
jgi:hypothetical protein